MKDACYHCNACIAVVVPQKPNACALSCDDCQCDVCDSAKGKKDISSPPTGYYDKTQS